jgi:hypothetical protein
MDQEEQPPALPDIALRTTARSRNATGRPNMVAWALTFAGVVLPFICFLVGFPRRPEWQSGNLSDYAALLLSHKGSAPMYPFLLYCMTCLWLAVWRPSRFADQFWVRMGVYFGVLVAAEYWLLFQFALPGDGGTVAGQTIVAAVGGLVAWAIWRFWASLGGSDHSTLDFVLRMILIGCGLLGSPWLALVSLWCATPWALAAYLVVAIGLLRQRGDSRLRFSLAQLFGLVGVLAAHLAAWRLSFTWMLEEYATLPTTAPAGCFVCTAAANGHAAVVHSQSWHMPDGTTCRVNDQLRTLKAFELLLVASSPGFHRRCRWAYDRVGPRAAALLCHPLLADAGYFLLKPPEWFARACLAVAIPGRMQLVRELYRANP